MAEVDEFEFGGDEDYFRAFQVVLSGEGTEKYKAMLRAHGEAPEYTITWARLAGVLGYSRGSAVNLHYGRLGEKIARQIGQNSKPIDPNGTRWWLWVLVRWASFRDPANNHTAFVLRRPVISALQRLGLLSDSVPELLLDEVEASSLILEGSRYRVMVNAYERSRVARAQCIAEHGTSCCVCGFSFQSVYGPMFDGYIHVHHLIPLSEIGGEYQVDAKMDMRPVCPNCHSVIHARRPPYGIEEVRSLIAKRRGG